MKFKNYFKSPEDLITPYEETRAGFVSLALEKNRQATPFVEEARALKIIASQAIKPSDLINIANISISLLNASGLSDKAMSHLTKEYKEKAISEFVKNFLEPAGKKFVEELVYRFLLTKGDSLGGIMRNLGGALGERKFIRSLLSTIKINGYFYHWFDGINWIEQSNNDVEIELRVKGVSWENKNLRTLLFNKTIPLVGKNVDICLFNCDYSEFDKSEISPIREPSKYIALGELKGGIDPAGADEHWKTANTSLDRIRIAFGKLNLYPKTFFVGAAIEKSMATEIYEQLNKNILYNAANLTNSEQLLNLCNWLVKL